MFFYNPKNYMLYIITGTFFGNLIAKYRYDLADFQTIGNYQFNEDL